MGGTHLNQIAPKTSSKVAIQKPGMERPPMAALRNR